MKICITISEMSQLQWHLGEGNIKQRSFIVDIPNESLPQGLQDFFKTREEELMFKKFSNLDSITIVEE
jgi:hypothetical protein